jgi:hypothetical protein
MDADLDREDEAVVGPGDNFWDLAEEQLAADLRLQPSDQEVAPYWRDVVAANMDRLVQPGNPDLVVPGSWSCLLRGTQSLQRRRPSRWRRRTPTTRQRLRRSRVQRRLRPRALPPRPPRPQRRQQPPPRMTPPRRRLPTRRPPQSTRNSPASSPPAGRPDEDHGGDMDKALPAVVVVGGLSSVALAVGLKRLIDRRRRRFVVAHDGQPPSWQPVRTERCTRRSPRWRTRPESTTCNSRSGGSPL